MDKDIDKRIDEFCNSVKELINRLYIIHGAHKDDFNRFAPNKFKPEES